MQRKKPTVKQLGNFVLNVYNKMREIERIAMGNSQAFLQYLEMTGELDKFNDYLKEKVKGQDNEGRKEHKKGKKKQTKRMKLLMKLMVTHLVKVLVLKKANLVHLMVTVSLEKVVLDTMVPLKSSKKSVTKLWQLLLLFKRLFLK